MGITSMLYTGMSIPYTLDKNNSRHRMKHPVTSVGKTNICTTVPGREFSVGTLNHPYSYIKI